MTDHQHDPLDDASQYWAGLAMRANRVLLETAESALGLQMQQFQRSARITRELLDTLTSGTDPARSLAVARQHCEGWAQTGTGLLDLALRSGQVLADLAQQSITTAHPPADNTRV